MEIRILEQCEKSQAILLVWNVFLEFEAPDYSNEGVNTFRGIMNNNDFICSLKLYGAFENENLIGVIATKNEGNHIALFFVHKDYQKQGIGRELFKCVVEDSVADKITVNSSPYAVGVYHKLGFIDTDTEQSTDGVRYTPMTFTK